jgi:glycosyltransferase involved in cell wall biosynthesis
MYFTDSPGFGGAEQVLLTLMVGINRQQWRPVLIHHPESGVRPLVERAAHSGVRVHALPPRVGRGAWGRVRQVRALLRVLWTERPDVFHANLAWPLDARYALLAAVLARVPAVIATQHSFFAIARHRDRWLQQLLAARVDRYVAVSDYLAQRLHQDLGIPTRKVEVVHNGVSTTGLDCLDGPRLRAGPTSSKARPVVLTLARLDRGKGHQILLEAAKLVPEAVFVFAGEGPMRSELEDRARALAVADRVVFRGFVDNVAELLANCDVFALASLEESFPISILEAMAACKPIVATAVGGVGESVTHLETGLLVPPSDPVALAAAIRTALSDVPLARHLATAGKTRVERYFTADRMVRRVTAIYDQVLDARLASGRGD